MHNWGGARSVHDLSLLRTCNNLSISLGGIHPATPDGVFYNGIEERGRHRQQVLARVARLLVPGAAVGHAPGVRLCSSSSNSGSGSARLATVAMRVPTSGTTSSGLASSSGPTSDSVAHARAGWGDAARHAVLGGLGVLGLVFNTSLLHLHIALSSPEILGLAHCTHGSIRARQGRGLVSWVEH